MKEAMAITGYVDEKLARQLAEGLKKRGRIDVRPERDVTDVVARASALDIAEVRTGATESGQVLVQLILQDGASVETVVRTSADPAGMKAFYDPVLNRVRQEATAKKIMI